MTSKKIKLLGAVAACISFAAVGTVLANAEAADYAIADSDYIAESSDFSEENEKNAQDYDSSSDLIWGDYTYSVNNDGTVTITGYTGSETDLTIPSVINGKRVTVIGVNVCFYYTGLKSVVIPNGVITIDEGAFSQCADLTAATIPDSVTSIEWWVFSECYNLTIYGSTGSCAEAYAKEENISFVDPNNVSIKATAVSGNRSVTLSWNAVSGASGYIVKSADGKTQYTAKSITATSYTVSGLKNGTQYKFKVYAKVGNKWYGSAKVSKTPVAKPQNVTATAGSQKVILNWDKVDNATSYVVKSADGKTQYTKKSIKTNTYTVTGLKNGTQYKFKVYAYSDGKWFASSTVTRTPTGKPQNVKAVAGCKKVTLSWDKVDGAKSYVIKSADGKTQYTKNAITANSYTVTGLTGGTQYKFKVYAYTDGKWYASNTVTKTAKVATAVSTTAFTSKTEIGQQIYASGVYQNWDGVTNVSQFVGSNGDLCFAYDDDDYVVVVKNKNGKTLDGTVKLKKQHPTFGTVTCDEDGNYYLVTGETNSTNDTSVNTVFVSKYNKNGKHIKTAGDNGSSSIPSYYDNSFYTKEPFHAGCCDAAISNGVIAVNYARSMYNGHQSNSIFAVDTETMEPVSLVYSYNSHSFAQRAIKADGGFLFVSEGDCYDRAFTITRASDSTKSTYNVFHFWVKDGALDEYNMHVVNNNFAHLGGIVDLGNGTTALVASSVKSLNSDANNESEQLFIQIFDPDKDLSSSSAYVTSGTRSGLGGPNGDENVTNYGVKWLTDFGDGVSIKNPQVAADENGNVVVLYEKYVNSSYQGVYYIVINSSGKVMQDSKLFSSSAKLNPCEMPVFAGGKVCWVGNSSSDSSHVYIYRLEITEK